MELVKNIEELMVSLRELDRIVTKAEAINLERSWVRKQIFDKARDMFNEHKGRDIEKWRVYSVHTIVKGGKYKTGVKLSIRLASSIVFSFIHDWKRDYTNIYNVIEVVEIRTKDDNVKATYTLEIRLKRDNKAEDGLSKTTLGVIYTLDNGCTENEKLMTGINTLKAILDGSISWDCYSCVVTEKGMKKQKTYHIYTSDDLKIRAARFN